MWYNFDVNRFGRWLLPPVLRSDVLLAILKVMLLPIRQVYDAFYRFRQSVNRKLKVQSTVLHLEKVLAEQFFLEPGIIYISTSDEPTGTYVHYSQSKMPLYVHSRNEAQRLYLREKKGNPPGVAFVVHVPTFLCTALDAADDLYKGIHLAEIYNLINYFKPAGRSYRIELYDYYE